MPSYRIEVADAHAHLFRVTLQVPKPDAEQVLSLPVWIPGSYLVREFARHLSQLEARQGTRPVPLQQLDKTTWQASCKGVAMLTISYWVYAFDNSVRTAFLDAQRGFFNGTSVFLRVHGREDEPQRVKITGLPRDWLVATALPALKGGSKNDYEAANYDELVDHPVEMGRLWIGKFRACGVPHEFVVSGAWPSLDGERLLADSKKICEEQIRLWHGQDKPPFKRYVFLLHAVDDGYGGLEHRASTALICSRRDLPLKAGSAKASKSLSDGYVTLLGLISHEYFHTWNVKRLQPSEFARYDYTRENYTQMLWFFEGFTSYYDDLVLRRAGLIDDARYAKLLGKTITQVLGTPGRRIQSLAQASFDAWTKYYRPDENTANATVSYYTKGALLALALDLTLRQEGGSLDGLMRRLWALQRPISEADLRAAAKAEAGRSLDAKLDAWIHGTVDLPLDTLLPSFGIKWQSLPLNAAQTLGMRLSEAGGSVKVQAVMRGSAAEAAGVAAGDELVALDGWRIRKNDDLNHLHQSTQNQDLIVARDQRILGLVLAASGAQRTGSTQPDASANVLLMPDPTPAEETLKRRDAWWRASA